MNFLIDNSIEVTLTELIENNDLDQNTINELTELSVNDVYFIGICEIKKVKSMTYQNITLDFINNKTPRDNYMSKNDLFQDVTTKCLIKIAKNTDCFNTVCAIMAELEKNQLTRGISDKELNKFIDSM